LNCAHSFKKNYCNVVEARILPAEATTCQFPVLGRDVDVQKQIDSTNHMLFTHNCVPMQISINQLVLDFIKSIYVS
jgi:hypothetical protein